MTATSSLSACPACVAAPAAEALAEAEAAPKDAHIMLSLPTIHCAACLSKVEAALNADPRVQSARVNLTAKRVAIDAAPETDPAEMISRITDAGFEAHELDATALSATTTDQAGRDLLMRLAVAGFAAMNVMLLSVAVWSGAEGATRDLFHWISAAIVIPATGFAALPFFRNAWRALRVGSLNMDVPISLAILLAIGTSLWETALSGEHAYFDAAITLTFFLLTGRYLDHRTRSVARSAAEELAALEVPRAWRVSDAGEKQVPVAELAAGDLIRVRPGGRLPVDGIVTEGHSELDRSLLTGETRPVAAAPGMAVSAGEVNLTGPMTVRATAVGRDSSLARMADLVAVAESGRSNYTSLADRAAKLYAPGVHILSALAFLGWLLWAGDLRVALNIAAAVLIITCPCALGLAVPAVTTAASGRLFRRGLLIKDATALERLAEVDTVVFDKTGTLTAGDPTPGDLSHITRRDLGIARALAEGSAHPLSRALALRLAEMGIPAVADLDDRRELPGFGAEATWQGRPVRLGRAGWVGAEAGDGTEAWLRIGDGDPLRIPFYDAMRDGAREAVAGLQKMGLHVALVSGDTAPAVARCAAELGIEDWQAGALPADKAARIQAFGTKGARVLMVGDGLNDTGALAAAHASLSPASALDAARVASDIVLLGNSLAPLPEAVSTARRAVRRIRENFTIATWYNIIAVPLAVAGLCSPLIAALAMSASSITVSLNALRLR
ncbi:heavy metal translocating P-type ATPase [Cognatishimia sp. F0-27]|uniref:heavy metal translocating P-type ATPase n=1 Tax=Cognatishimia sp. F0-27 TaxID=2816855 RepID=UPI001D0C6045|nr:heavy metal translocating P-type ATPase [Cognatishimia sp. F0-27]MCC1491690.1 cadmium-translocating P-type ATPase [Cognatishimia sp. F0-27]